jgi:hypothetical protein
MSVRGPRLPTWASQQHDSYMGYTRRVANLAATAARGPTLCENFEFVLEVRISVSVQDLWKRPALTAFGYEAKTKKAIFDEFRPGTFSRSLARSSQCSGCDKKLFAKP